MKPSPLLARVVTCLLTLVCTKSTLTALDNAIQMTLKGGWASPTEPVRQVQVVSPYAYLVVGESGLQVLNVSTPTNPVPLGRYDAAHRINGIHVDGHHAYLATGDSFTETNDPGVLEVIDVSQPTNLVFLSQTETSKRANTVCVTGDFAYLGEGASWSESNRVGAVEIFSVTNPTTPIVMGRYDAGDPVNDIKVADGYAYLAGGGAALTILDVNDSCSPVWVGEFSTNNVSGGEVHGVAIEVNDQYAYLSSSESRFSLDIPDPGSFSFFILDIRDRSRPVLIGELGPFSRGTRDYGVSAHVVKHLAFVVVQQYDPETGLWHPIYIIVADPSNLSNPADLMHHALGRFIKPASLVDLQLANGHAYMAVTGGLLVYEFTELPYFKSIAHVADRIVLNWNDLPDVKLKSTPSLVNPDWTDVPGSLGTNRIELPLSTNPEFFRLIQPQNAP